MGKIENIGIICKKKSPINREVLTELTAWLRKRKFRIFMDRETAAIIGETSSHPKAEIPAVSDIMIALGGDGTILNVAHLTPPFEVPILAVNLGSLGFLTEVTLPELYGMLEKVLAGDFSIEQRMLLNAQLLRQGNTVEEFFILNDVVINKAALARIIDLEVHVDNQYMTSYRADGLIIATPTGSTAYSLSAGGPIIHPSLHLLVISPICPFILTNRSIVIPDGSLIQVRLTTENENVQITVDGQQGCEMRIGDVLEIKMAKTTFKLIQGPRKNYYETLRKKLNWGRPANIQNPGGPDSGKKS